MKKKLLSLALVLALCLALLPTAVSAADNSLPETWQEAMSDVSLRYPLGNGHVFGTTAVAWQDRDLTLVKDVSPIEWEYIPETSALTGYCAVRSDTVFTLSRAPGSADDTSVVMVYVIVYIDTSIGRYECIDWPPKRYLTRTGGFIHSYNADPDAAGGYVELKPGESVQFELPKDYDYYGNEFSDVVYELGFEKYYPDYAEDETDEYGNTYPVMPCFFRWYYCKVDEACVEETIAEIPFDDVRFGDYYDLPVIWAVQNEITNGTNAEGTAFSPAQACTHAQILTFLYRAARGEGAAAAADMAEAVSWAREKGMIDGSFDGSRPCTRAETVSYIWQAFDKPDAPPSSFTDVPASADYAAAVNWAVANGIVEGYPDGAFHPDTVCSRGVIVTMLYRAYVESARLNAN